MAFEAGKYKDIYKKFFSMRGTLCTVKVFDVALQTYTDYTNIRCVEMQTNNDYKLSNIRGTETQLLLLKEDLPAALTDLTARDRIVYRSQTLAVLACDTTRRTTNGITLAWTVAVSL